MQKHLAKLSKTFLIAGTNAFEKQQTASADNRTHIHGGSATHSEALRSIVTSYSTRHHSTASIARQAAHSHRTGSFLRLCPHTIKFIKNNQWNVCTIHSNLLSLQCYPENNLFTLEASTYWRFEVIACEGRHFYFLHQNTTKLKFTNNPNLISTTQPHINKKAVTLRPI